MVFRLDGTVIHCLPLTFHSIRGNRDYRQLISGSSTTLLIKLFYNGKGTYYCDCCIIPEMDFHYVIISIRSLLGIVSKSQIQQTIQVISCP